MQVHQAEIIISAVSRAQYPPNGLPDIAFAGRSNVGKSSIINKLCNRKGLARTSSKPGKTATINFYEIEKQLHLVDLPGYGFARVSKGEKKKWHDMIEEYLTNRHQLQMVILMVDARHKPSDDDVGMFDWIKNCQGAVLVVATKSDKLKPKELEKNILTIRETLKMDDEDILVPFSSETGLGKGVVWKVIEEALGQ
ncbi:MAG: YihA family ribosome biogenesis GTP-binding protein [Hyphomonadaceae bacterium]|nr:YihA family ribosome biogenesis GTP-binding protein [Clostridia bacterium]